MRIKTVGRFFIEEYEEIAPGIITLVNLTERKWFNHPTYGPISWQELERIDRETEPHGN